MKNLASKLRQRITIEEPVYTSDLLGGFVTAWNVYATLWAEIVPVGRIENLRSEKLQNANSYKITVRYIPNITTKMRISHKGKFYAIRSVINVEEKNEKLEIIANEEV